MKIQGRYQLACGHVVQRVLDVEERQRCPKCRADTIVVRVLPSERERADLG